MMSDALGEYENSNKKDLFGVNAYLLSTIKINLLHRVPVLISEKPFA
jgi:hypothetical protein